MENKKLLRPLEISNYILDQELGEGGFGKVYYCKPKHTGIDAKVKEKLGKGKQIACKRISFRGIKNEETRSLINSEIAILKRLQHKNMLKLVDKCKSANNIYLFFEFCNGGSLRELINIKGYKPNEILIRLIMSQIVEGINYLQYFKNNPNVTQSGELKSIVHRDLKSDNIMLNFPYYKKSRCVPKSFISEFLKETLKANKESDIRE
jgi:eukaryotic-like serine/threonine-protein kinase